MAQNTFVHSRISLIHYRRLRYTYKQSRSRRLTSVVEAVIAANRLSRTGSLQAVDACSNVSDTVTGTARTVSATGTPGSALGGDALIANTTATCSLRRAASCVRRVLRTRSSERRAEYYKPVSRRAFAIMIVPSALICLFIMLRLAVWGKCRQKHWTDSSVCLIPSYPIAMFDGGNAECACDMLAFFEFEASPAYCEVTTLSFIQQHLTYCTLPEQRSAHLRALMFDVFAVLACVGLLLE